MSGTSETQVTVHDRVDPARAEALMATIGMSVPRLDTGDPLPPFFHHIYFWDTADATALGPDGHRAKAGLIPDMAGAHRMWAGGRLTFHNPFCAGIAARKISTLKEVTQKTGRSGPMAFVTLQHDIHQRGRPVLTEDQVLVYRAEPGTPAARGGEALRLAEFRTPLNLPVTTLFRYSALTFNAHRIHYDRDYCVMHEGFPGLVVHGPLMAQHLALLAAERMGPLSSFTYRARAPLFEGETTHLCATGQDVWIEGPDSRICMTAAATPAR